MELCCRCYRKSVARYYCVGSIRRLHEIGLNVICIVADGAKPNRRFMKDHSHKEGTKNGIVYKARNIYNPSMFVYFMSDVPHLIKTTRNCWLCSQFGGVRCLWVCKPTMYAHTHTSIRNHVGSLKFSGENPVYTRRCTHQVHTPVYTCT